MDTFANVKPVLPDWRDLIFLLMCSACSCRQLQLERVVDIEIACRVHFGFWWFSATSPHTQRFRFRNCCCCCCCSSKMHCYFLNWQLVPYAFCPTSKQATQKKHVSNWRHLTWRWLPNEINISCQNHCWQVALATRILCMKNAGVNAMCDGLGVRTLCVFQPRVNQHRIERKKIAKCGEFHCTEIRIEYDKREFSSRNRLDLNAFFFLLDVCRLWMKVNIMLENECGSMWSETTKQELFVLDPRMFTCDTRLTRTPSNIRYDWCRVHRTHTTIYSKALCDYLTN